MDNSFYFNTSVQSSIQKELKRVMGIYNKEDATQEAYVAITNENPLTSEDACNCVVRAIHRYRDRISKIDKREYQYVDDWMYKDEKGNRVPRIWQSDDSFGSDYVIRHAPTGIDLLQPDTDRFNKHSDDYYKNQYRAVND